MKEIKRSDQTRKNILSAGRLLIGKHGYSAVGLALILKESNVPKGSFYHYFPSKEAFGQALLDDYVTDYLTRVDTLSSGPGTAGEKLSLLDCLADTIGVRGNRQSMPRREARGRDRRFV